MAQLSTLTCKYQGQQASAQVLPSILDPTWAQLLAQARDALEIVAGQNDVEVLAE